MFRLFIVAIFKEVFLKGVLHRTYNIIENIDKIFVLNCVFEFCIYIHKILSIFIF
jgi:hypothetical protein